MRKLQLVATAGLILSLSLLGACGSEEEIQLSPKQEEAMVERVKPDGKVTLSSEVASAPAASASSGPRDGETVYNTGCKSCHAIGAAGAPKFGAAGEWTDRIAKGVDTLYAGALNGIGGMPPKGLCMDCSPEEINAAVDYMLEAIQ